MSSGERDELLLLPTKGGARKPAGAKTERDGGVASKHKVPLSTYSETHLACSLDLALANNKFWPVAQRTVTSPHKRVDAGSNPAVESTPRSSVDRAPRSLFSTYSPAIQLNQP